VTEEHQRVLIDQTDLTKYVTLEHKTSHNGQFLEIEMYASSES